MPTRVEWRAVYKTAQPRVAVLLEMLQEVLRMLMDANNLRQKDLAPIFCSESIVSEVLHKKRDLNETHIEKLSKRFRVSPAAFS